MSAFELSLEKKIPRYLKAYNLFLPVPAKGLFLSSQSVTPSQAQILFEFCATPEDLAMIPHESNFPQFPLTNDKGDFPLPKSSASSETTMERPMISETLTSLSAIRNVARPSPSALTLPKSPTCRLSMPSIGLPCLVCLQKY